MANTIGLSRIQKIEGNIIWGGSGDVNSTARCNRLKVRDFKSIFGKYGTNEISLKALNVFSINQF